MRLSEQDLQRMVRASASRTGTLQIINDIDDLILEVKASWAREAKLKAHNRQLEEQRDGALNKLRSIYEVVRLVDFTPNTAGDAHCYWKFSESAEAFMPGCWSGLHFKLQPICPHCHKATAPVP